MQQLVRADKLRPGDRLFWTGETVVRTFTDRMTKLNYINVTLQKECGKTRTATYKERRRIRLIGRK